MIYDRRPDYCDLQISIARKGTVEIHEVDPDGIPYVSQLSTYDGWAVEFFLFMGIEHDLKGFHKKYYQTRDGSLVWAREGDKKEKASLQFKGSFFLQENWEAQFTKAILFFKNRNITFHPSRWDVGILFQVKDERNFYRLVVDKNKWSGMRCHYQFDTEVEQGFIAKHSRLEVAFYNKHRQVRDVKQGSDYQDRILRIAGVEELPHDLMKCDIRIRQKDQTRAITKLLQMEKINFQAIEAIVLKKCDRKTKMGRILKKTLGLAKK